MKPTRPQARVGPAGRILVQVRIGLFRTAAAERRGPKARRRVVCVWGGACARGLVIACSTGDMLSSAWATVRFAWPGMEHCSRSLAVTCRV